MKRYNFNVGEIQRCHWKWLTESVDGRQLGSSAWSFSMLIRILQGALWVNSSYSRLQSHIKQNSKRRQPWEQSWEIRFVKSINVRKAWVNIHIIFSSRMVDRSNGKQKTFDNERMHNPYKNWLSSPIFCLKKCLSNDVSQYFLSMSWLV